MEKIRYDPKRHSSKVIFWSNSVWVINLTQHSDWGESNISYLTTNIQAACSARANTSKTAQVAQVNSQN
jgi:hypothetical protein